ncbi:hypothetical protein A2164_02430 [Candidatus Curtissbacteria bacterium RBG_13_35_7]|uniref:HTH cro/C1-type domain-containing protein n=1 Tax=Candidatus Curtissbacteria bacterium RBG_13_35_7 TaxID=1797705 RepID=A0A1F5G145_9BACT|nr:MAG: hypothetical protein A2164_02430 [Candidatus Curtissbacteria bacterium RBG_13_35_7]
MRNFGETFSSKRKSSGISIKKASKKLLIKEEHLKALENEDWQKLPETTFVKGYITSYAQFLNLDPGKMQALFRREYDEKKYSKKQESIKIQKSFFITPKRIRNLIIICAILSFVSYIALQYSSVLQAPDLQIINPPDDITVSIQAVQISGKTEKETTVSIDGQFIPINEEGSFTYQYTLKEGKNVIEIIAAKRLSPKSKTTRTIRLVQ